MRSAIVATPALLPERRPAPGALDGKAIRARLPLPDSGFHVVELDAGQDLAEQLDILFDTNPPEAGSPILFYASCSVALAVDGELFLCLDPANPQTGDSLKDIASVLRDRASGPLLIVVECRHPVEAVDPSRSAAITSAAKSAIEHGSEIELLVAARPPSRDDEEHQSPFTRAFIEALDDADPTKGLTVQALYESVRDSAKLADSVPSFVYARGQTAFELIPPSLEPASEAPDEGAEESAPDEEEHDEIEPLERAPSSELAPETSAEDALLEAQDEAPIERLARAPSAESPLQGPHSGALAHDEDAHHDLTPVSLSSDALEPMPMSIPPESIPVNVSFETTGVVTSPLETSPLDATGSFPVSFETTGSVNVSFDASDSSGTPGSTPPPSIEPTSADYLASGDRLVEEDSDEALLEYKRALALLAGDAKRPRAEIYIRIATIKASQDKRREAIAHFEKALQAIPTHKRAIEQLIELTFLEEDWLGMQGAEERLFALISDPDERFSLLVTYAERWGGVALDAERARMLLERARDIKPADIPVLRKLRLLYEAVEAIDEALDTRRRLAELQDDPEERAREYLEIGRYCLDELKNEPLALDLFDSALDSDATQIEPLSIVERVLEERQEWRELEQVYRRTIERLELAPRGPARTEVSWDVYRRLAFLYRDHLSDPLKALQAFEDAIARKPDDIDSHCFAVELARATGHLEQAARHLQAMATLDPTTTSTFHDLFEVFQKLRRPDQAYAAACVTMHLNSADARERFIYEEHHPEATPVFTEALRAGAWALLRVEDTDAHVEAILSAVGPAAVAAKIALLDDEKRLPSLDPAAKLDPKTSTVSIVRSFVWGSHFLSVPAPSVYIREASSVGLAAVMAAEPSVIIGSLALRGRSMRELAFLVGRHLAYHVGSHRLLLYYPSLDELSVCFLATLRVALKSLPIPANFRDAVHALAPRIEALLDPDGKERIKRVVAALDASGMSADITRWVSGVEHCASRAGYLLCGDLDVAAQILRAEPLGMVAADDKVHSLVSFTVSDAYHALRNELGAAIEP